MARSNRSEDIQKENRVTVSTAGRIDTGRGLWMYAVSVGKADAILVGTGDFTCLIDTGYARARGKILTSLKQLGVERLDAVFATHTDIDHTGGLDWLAGSNIKVDAWCASAMYTGVKKEKHPMVRAAAKRGETVRWLKAGDCVTMGGAAWNVLAPETEDTRQDDNNSLVLLLSTKDGSVLLTGDMEFPEEKLLLKSGVSLKCDVLKVPNHAHNDTMSKKFIQAASPRIAVISTSSGERPDTPSAHALKRLQSVNAEIAVTEECTGGILVRLEAGEISMERIDLPQPGTKVSIKKVSKKKDVIVLQNEGKTAEDLAGHYLVSRFGREWFVFPEDTVIAPGEKLVVGTKVSKKKIDLCWSDERIVRKIKKDVISLYDANGMLVSMRSNKE